MFIQLLLLSAFPPLFPLLKFDYVLGFSYKVLLNHTTLGPLLFLIYINDLSNGVTSDCKPFADDTPLHSVVNDIQSTLRSYLTQIAYGSKQLAFDGKLFLVLIRLNKGKRWYLAEKLRIFFTLLFHLITFL